MFDGKFLCTLAAIIIAALAICKIEKKNSGLIENFMGLVPGGKTKIATQNVKKIGIPTNFASLMAPSTAKNTNSLVQRITGGTASVVGNINSSMENYQHQHMNNQDMENYHHQHMENYQHQNMNNQHMNNQHMNNQHMNSQHMNNKHMENYHHQNMNSQHGKQPFGFQVPPNMQKMLSPRGTAESFGLGTNIRYNKPSHEKMAYTNPSQFGNMVQENYGAKEQRCGVSGSPYQASPTPEQSNYTNGNFADVRKTLPKLPGAAANKMLSNSLPIPTMDSAGGADGGEDVVNYNRMITANPNSRTRGAGCPFRGDLQVVPRRTGLFDPPANPTLDLQQGAMQVMAGIQPMDSNTADGARLMATVGENYYAGMLMNEQQLSSINAMTDVQVSRLP
jgi:hypothetical protein